MASKPGHASQHHISDTDSDATIDPTDNDNISFSDEETRKDFDHTPSKSKGKVKLGNKDKSFSKLEASLHDISSSDSDATVDLSFDSGSKSKRTERKNISKKGLPVTSPVQNKSYSERKTRDSVISDSDSDDATSYLFKSSLKTFHEKPSSCPKKAISDSDSDDATSYLFKSSPSEKTANPSYNGKKKTGNISNEPSTVMSTKRNPLHAKRTAKDNIISDSDSDDATSYLFKSSPKKENLKKDKSTSKTTVPAPTSTLSNTTIGNSASLGKQLCPYGVKCYRKNPSHFEEFKHSAAKSPSLKRKLSDKEEKGHGLDADVKRQKTTIPRPSSSKVGTESGRNHIKYKPGDAAGIIQQAEPLGFLLTKVTGIEEQHNSTLAIDIKDILSPSMGNLEKSAQFNFKIDIPWLVSKYALPFRTKPLLIIHGAQRAEKAALDMEAAAFDHIKLGQAKLEILYGTHHTKMMLLLYDNGMRVVIHTSNLIEQDWFQKTQGVWVSPLFPKLPKESATEGDSTTCFKHDLMEYLTAYKLRPLEEWLKIIREHDMSQACVYLIGSVPGRHTGEKRLAFGHMKLRKLLRKYGPTKAISNWPVVGQFSSIGSLGNTAAQWLRGEWLDSLSSTQNTGPLSKPKLELIYPSKENVRQSLEGYAAGGSLPYSINTATKQQYLHTFFHHWHSDVRGRNLACPHIKTYLRPSQDYSEIAWFLVTSANLSKAAWGALEKGGIQLMIRSYELGVLFLPQHFKCSTFRTMKRGDTQALTTDDTLIFPIPYDLPPVPYRTCDRPWIWDIPYVDRPDTHGTKWCPPLK